VLGGDAEAIDARLTETWSAGLDRDAAVRVGAAALGGPDREIPPAELEVAALSRNNGRRCFHRLDAATILT
jgi:proteasome alpha subunit